MAVRLRASPAIGVGGMYATGQGVDHFVVTAAMVPDVWERQKWSLKPVEKGVQVVFSDNINDRDHIPWVWGYTTKEPLPNGPLVLTTELQKQVTWSIQSIDNGIPNANTLIADIGLVGATWYAGTNRENQVIFKVLPIDAPDDEKPYWVITPAGK